MKKCVHRELVVSCLRVGEWNYKLIDSRVSTVPGQTALTLIPSSMKSAAIDLVIPMTAAFVVPYTNLLGTPLIEEATEDMLMIEPDFCFTI